MLACTYVVESMRFSENWTSERGINATDARAMALLDQARLSTGSLSAGQLSDALGLSSPATSALIRRLEAAGHVIRARDPEDRRRVLVSLSESSQRDAVAYFRPMGRAVNEAVERLEPGEQAIVIAFLENLVAGTRALTPETGEASGTKG